MIDRSQTDWYKDAIVYQLHVKAFQDANNDGIGDFAGLMQRLDYVQDLGVTAIWLLPFYPSPLRDDGYDISDYTAINPAYGRMRDFRAFIAEAHRRGLRVITELVINHTSDQHPWFQRARRAKPGSAARDFYVWSDTDQKFPETRIIFLDTEKSNWTWDPEAGAYFWHRFYSHQPDLNFDNPRVLREVLRIMRMWLDMGVDGLRLDAIPYLVEREGTNNENLPETHVILKKIRAELDAHYSDRMLLAEANQWPEDTRPYFGDGDECQMGFHFPLMPRMYMALAQEDRHPVTDIIRQTPDIPENCQWGIFLRNHDELTLEMVTDQERDYLWRTYAEDSRARINLGIRRRLAPLMQNDRRKIELMNSLLLSMPGTPILYYGDEVGMGDNYYLGDRDGVRTPMQWSSDRNAGFSRADPQQLYLPVILDPVYGYQAINVEGESRDPSSLLNWTRRMIAVRKEHPAFGRGTTVLLYPRNRKVLAYVRQYDGDSILCVVNLSRAAQAVELDLAQWKGAVPIELTGRSAFPPIGDLPYLVTLPAYGFYWFLLAAEGEAPRWHQPQPEVLPEFVTLTCRDGRVGSALSGREKELLEDDILPKFLPLQQWYADGDRPIGEIGLSTFAETADGHHALASAVVTANGGRREYLLPLSALWGEEHLDAGTAQLSHTLGKLRRGARVGALVDGAFDADFSRRIVAGMRGEAVFEDTGTIVFSGTEALDRLPAVSDPYPVAVGEANVSIAFGTDLVLKFYRRIRRSIRPDIEIQRFLTERAGFRYTPTFLGEMAHRPESGDPATLAAAFGYLQNQGNARNALADALQRDLEDFELAPSVETGTTKAEFVFPLTIGSLLGQRTAEMHRALATATDDPAFAAEKITHRHVEAWTEQALEGFDRVPDHLERLRHGLPERADVAVETVVKARDVLRSRLRVASGMRPSGGISRIHGDYRLGRVLLAKDDLAIVGFGGAPDAGRDKASPLADVASMLLSFHETAARTFNAAQPAPDREPVLAGRLAEWSMAARRDFLDAYREHVAGSPSDSRDTRLTEALLDLFVIGRAARAINAAAVQGSAPIEGALAALAELARPGLDDL
ncbi:maltose alpha-D-glucosyltransferase [Mesorhizobium koreense]|uniref:maltose alpha-D-glucosyltransferase n=1 Tax=Mesorhizobium koreense TaxID=3074855 RepID=UPI003FA5E47D